MIAGRIPRCEFFWRIIVGDSVKKRLNRLYAPAPSRLVTRDRTEIFDQAIAFGNLALTAFPNRAGLSGERTWRAARPLAEKKKNSFPYVQGRTGGGEGRTRNPVEPEAICHALAGYGGAATAQNPLRNSVEKS